MLQFKCLTTKENLNWFFFEHLDSSNPYKIKSLKSILKNILVRNILSNFVGDALKKVKPKSLLIWSHVCSFLVCSFLSFINPQRSIEDFIRWISAWASDYWNIRTFWKELSSEKHNELLNGCWSSSLNRLGFFFMLLTDRTSEREKWKRLLTKWAWNEMRASGIRKKTCWVLNRRITHSWSDFNDAYIMGGFIDLFSCIFLAMMTLYSKQILFSTLTLKCALHKL